MSNLNIDGIDYQNNNIKVNELFLTSTEVTDDFIQRQIFQIENEKEKLIKMFNYIIHDFECYLSSDNISLIRDMFVEKKPPIINLKASYGKYCFKFSKKFYEDPITYT